MTYLLWELLRAVIRAGHGAGSGAGYQYGHLRRATDTRGRRFLSQLLPKSYTAAA